MDAALLKEQLQLIREHNFAVPDHIQLSTLVQAMLEHIGSTDSELRDRLIYGTLVRWIELNPVFTADELRQIWQTCLDDNHLLYQINEPENDGVFKRSFSVLVIPLLLIRSGQEAFLNADDIRYGKARVLDYLAREQDRRGFVMGKGWAHAVAHAADALNEFVLCEALDAADLKTILESVQSAASTDICVYTHAEEERLLEVFDSIVGREILSVEFLAKWIESFADLAENQEPPEGYTRFINVKHFLQALFFRCDKAEYPEVLKESLSLTLNGLLDT